MPLQPGDRVVIHPEALERYGAYRSLTEPVRGTVVRCAMGGVLVEHQTPKGRVVQSLWSERDLEAR